jgi:hypothetical protein
VRNPTSSFFYLFLRPVQSFKQSVRIGGKWTQQPQSVENSERATSETNPRPPPKPSLAQPSQAHGRLARCPSAHSDQYHPLLLALAPFALVGTHSSSYIRQPPPLFHQSPPKQVVENALESSSKAPSHHSSCVCSKQVSSSCDSSICASFHSEPLVFVPSSASHLLHITLHPSHASSPFLRLTRQPTGVREEALAGAAAAAVAGAGTCWCWSNFSPRHNLATRAHTTHPFVLVPPPSPQRSLLVAPTLAWSPQLVSTLPATNLPLETRHTYPSGPAFSHLGPARDPRLVFVTPAPVATQRSLQNSGS